MNPAGTVFKVADVSISCVRAQEPPSVPEPATTALILVGGTLVAIRRRKVHSQRHVD